MKNGLEFTIQDLCAISYEVLMNQDTPIQIHLE